MTPPTLRIGMLGAARITPMALIRPARQVPGVELRAVAARDPERARRFAARHGIPTTHATYEALLDDPDIDAIYNPLPNGLHCEWTVRALEAGKHVLCEKPMAANADEAARMLEASRRAGRLLVEAFHYRYHPLAERLRAIIDGGELGTIRHIETHFCVPLLVPGDIRFRYDLAGGATMDVGSYTVNLLRFLAGDEPKVLQARPRLASPEVDRYMTADMRFADGRTGRIVCSLVSLILVRVRALVRGDRGTLTVFNPYLPHLVHSLRVRTAAGTRRERVRGDSTYVHQLRAFAAAAAGGPPPPTDGADAVANMRVVDAIYDAAGMRRRGLG